MRVMYKSRRRTIVIIDPSTRTRHTYSKDGSGSSPKIVKKHGNKKFKRHHSDRYARVGESWRKPKGIDSAVRRRFRGTVRMPKIGYGSDKRTKYLAPSGLKSVVVSNAAELDTLILSNKYFAAEIAHSVSSRKRAEIVEKAKTLSIHVTNASARLSSQA